MPTIAELRARGFALENRDGHLIVSPGSALTDDDRAAIRANREALLDALDHEQALRTVNAVVGWPCATEDRLRLEQQRRERD